MILWIFFLCSSSELFLRGRSFLCTKIQRTRVKGTWVRTSSSPESEPDFYAMDPVTALNEQRSGSSSDGNSVIATEDLDRMANTAAACVTPKLAPRAEQVTSDSQFHPESTTLEPSCAAVSISSSSSVASDTGIAPPCTSSSSSIFFGLQPPPSLPSSNHLSSSMIESSSDSNLSFFKDEMAFSSLNLPSQFSTTHGAEYGGTGISTSQEPFSCQYPQSHKLLCRPRDMPSLTELRALSYPAIFDDDDLGSFLREVDLGLELEMAEDLLIQTASI